MGSLEKNLPHIIILGVLIVVLLFMLVQFGFLRCCDIPGFCSVYYGVKGEPKMLILYGENGSGDPQALRKFFEDEARVFPSMMSTDVFQDPETLKHYEMVVVDNAKQLTTKQLLDLRSYVQQGGQLVWIGDSGTMLGENDYVCESVTFYWRPLIKQMRGKSYSCNDIVDYGRSKDWDEEVISRYVNYCEQGNCFSINDTEASQICQAAQVVQESCGEWMQETPNDPEELEAGICGHSFGEVVKAYDQLYEEEYKKATSLGGLCPAETEPFYIQGNERVEACINKIKADGENVSKLSAEEIESECAGMYNYWQRGPSYDMERHTRLNDGIDFSNDVLGFDYYMTMPLGVYLKPVDTSHKLVRGYETSVWLADTNVTLVDTSRFAQGPRTHTLMALEVSGKGLEKTWPAVLISNPLLSPFKNGLVIFYAFPPEELLKNQGKGSNLLRNLADWLYCR